MSSIGTCCWRLKWHVEKREALTSRWRSPIPEGQDNLTFSGGAAKRILSTCFLELIDIVLEIEVLITFTSCLGERKMWRHASCFILELEVKGRSNVNGVSCFSALLSFYTLVPLLITAHQLTAELSAWLRGEVGGERENANAAVPSHDRCSAFLGAVRK